MEDYPIVADQTLSFDDIEAEHVYRNCHFTVLCQLLLVIPFIKLSNPLRLGNFF